MRLADDFFGARQSGYALWAREHGDGDLERTAEQEGLHELERLPELVLEELPDYLPPPEDVEIRRAQDVRTREDYLDLVADAWGMASMPREVAARGVLRPGQPRRAKCGGVRGLLRRHAAVGGDDASHARRGARLPGRHDPPAQTGPATSALGPAGRAAAAWPRAVCGRHWSSARASSVPDCHCARPRASGHRYGSGSATVRSRPTRATWCRARPAGGAPPTR